MSHLSPVIRISLGLVLLTCSVVTVLDLAGLVPTVKDREAEIRVQLAEMLGAQTAASIENSDLRAARAALETAVRRNDSVLAAALRSAQGRLLLTAGNHRELWNPEPDGRPPATHASVPLLRKGRSWGTLEIRFVELRSGGPLAALWARPLVRLLVILGATCFVLYLAYLKRTLRHLDPSAVIPARVQAALDVMAGGVLVLDASERIVLANAFFAKQLASTPAALLGTNASGLSWRPAEGRDALERLPWARALQECEKVEATRVLLDTGLKEPTAFMVRAAPVLDGWGGAKGAIATFDDVTELERKSTELERALAEIEKSQEEIRLQNEELQILARHDSLTGVLNRRHFFDVAVLHFGTAKRARRNVSCLMVDIDLFKLVNDNHGHAMGDEVIKRVAEALSSTVRETDAVCRYGGEEFCVAMPDADADAAAAVAERIRKKIESPGFARIPVTASLGVSSIQSGAETLYDLIHEADQALYASKKNGRNRVTRWDEIADGSA